VPLTSGLTGTAQADITKDVVGGASTDAYLSGCPASKAPASTPPSSTSAAPPSSTSNSPTSPHPASTGVVPSVSPTGSSGVNGSGTPAASSHISGHPTAFGGLSTGPRPTNGGGSGTGGAGGPQYLQNLTLASSSSRILLPLALLLGLLAIVFGAFVAYSPAFRAQLIGLARETRRRVGSGMGKVGARLSSWAGRGPMTR
jgi:hypothetical protein